MSEAGGEFALPMARATRTVDPAYGPANEVAADGRGSGIGFTRFDAQCGEMMIVEIYFPIPGRRRLRRVD